ncbi:MAG: site-2 protease family protein [Chloroflexaceae bacterium]|nr:site-2 protease family protein [Chloroflexaceae bacterium]NJO04264.1 site-2 protease family protein [Chloroflexaceae bacterium]
MRQFSFTPGEFTGRLDERMEFIKAGAGTALAYAIFFSGGNIFQSDFFRNLLIAMFTAGLAVVIHEYAHRLLARSYGADAYFKANDGMLVMSILIAFASFFVAAPGAVYPRGFLSQQRIGMVALAGPASNFLLAGIFMAIFIVLSITQTPVPIFWRILIIMAYDINAWLGLFNLIPIAPFDGEKIWRWNRVVFGITVALGVLLVFVLPRMLGLP